MCLKICNSRKIAEDIGTIGLNQHIYFLSGGKWSTHELLAYLLRQSGPAKVVLSTFSFSESGLSTLWHLLNTGLITQLDCLFDASCRKNKLDLLFFAKNITPRVGLTNCHAKIMTITNENTSIAVIGSANLNENPRYEAGVICTVREIVEKYKTEIQSLIDKSIPFENA